MTREEEIKKQAERYTDDASNYTEWSDDGGWSDTNDVELVEKAFIEGAEWADNHPVNVWHDASEEPKEHSKIVIIDTRGEWWVRNYVSDDFDDNILYGWKCCIAYYDLKIWAYTDDLLPKGGEK